MTKVTDLIDEDAVYSIGKKVADGSGWRPKTGMHSRIWLAAQAGARAAFRMAATLQETNGGGK